MVARQTAWGGSALEDDVRSDEFLFQTLRLASPGTALHEALEGILRARTGALIVIGDSEEGMSLVNGGFHIDAEMTPAAVYEMDRMGGAGVTSASGRRNLR